jgi:hypothetical protein
MARKLCSWRLATPSPKADLCHALSPRSYVVPCSLAPSFRSASVLKCVGVRTTSLALGQPKFESHEKLNIRYLMESSSIKKKKHWVLMYGMISFFFLNVSAQGERYKWGGVEDPGHACCELCQRRWQRQSSFHLPVPSQPTKRSVPFFNPSMWTPSLSSHVTLMPSCSLHQVVMDELTFPFSLPNQC